MPNMPFTPQAWLSSWSLTAACALAPVVQENRLGSAALLPTTEQDIAYNAAGYLRSLQDLPRGLSKFETSEISALWDMSSKRFAFIEFGNPEDEGRKTTISFGFGYQAALVQFEAGLNRPFCEKDVAAFLGHSSKGFSASFNSDQISFYAPQRSLKAYLRSHKLMKAPIFITEDTGLDLALAFREVLQRQIGGKLRIGVDPYQEGATSIHLCRPGTKAEDLTRGSSLMEIFAANEIHFHPESPSSPIPDVFIGLWHYLIS